MQKKKKQQQTNAKTKLYKIKNKYIELNWL